MFWLGNASSNTQIWPKVIQLQWLSQFYAENHLLEVKEPEHVVCFHLNVSIFRLPFTPATMRRKKPGESIKAVHVSLAGSPIASDKPELNVPLKTGNVSLKSHWIFGFVWYLLRLTLERLMIYAGSRSQKVLLEGFGYSGQISFGQIHWQQYYKCSVTWFWFALVAQSPIVQTSSVLENIGKLFQVYDTWYLITTDTLFSSRRWSF